MYAALHKFERRLVLRKKSYVLGISVVQYFLRFWVEVDVPLWKNPEVLYKISCDCVIERFAPQMLYDIRIEMLSNDPQNDGTVLYAFNVEYKIHRNDGTFRNDIDSDASKKLYFELYEDTEGLVRIDRITYYVR